MRTIAVLFAFALAASNAVAEETVDIKEWQVPWAESRPRDPFAESADSVWFVGQRAGYLAHLDVKTGEMMKVDLPEGEGPHNLIVGEDGVVWYAGNLTGVIGRYDPKTKKIETIPMPDPAARDPHTLVFDGKGNIWFTVQGGNFIGRLNMESRKVDLIPSKTERSRPYGVKIAPDGTVWVVLFGTYKLAKVDPASLELTEIDLPRQEARPRRLEVTADGRVWYGDYAKGRLGVYDPRTQQFEEWMLPSGEGSRPYAMASDSSGRVWVIESGVQPNLMVGFDPKMEKFFGSTPVPSGGGTVRHTHYHEPSGTVWFGTDTNYIGRAIVEPAE
jgi:virginiamycin B lyase